MYRFSLMCVAALGAILLSGASIAPDMIAGTSYIDPTSIYYVSSECPSLDGGAVDTINDGSGLPAPLLNTATGGANGDEAGWETTGLLSTLYPDNAGFFPAAPLPVQITFDLGAHYNLTGTRIWNYNAGSDFAAYCGGCEDVTISVANTDTGTPPSFRWRALR